jgi:hypothetical protein
VLRGTDLPTWLILAANRLVMQRLPEPPSAHGCVADEGLVLIQPRRPDEYQLVLPVPRTNEREEERPEMAKERAAA